jgi:hypothetical protein
MLGVSATPAQTLSPSSVIEEALTTYKDNIGILLPAALGLFAINFVLAVIFLGSSSGGLIIGIVALILQSLFTAFVIELARDADDGKVDSSIGELFNAVTPVLASVIGLSIIVAVGVGIGLVLIVIPGLILMTIWAVAVPVVVLERPGVFASLGRSQALVKGHGWQVFFVILFIIALSIAVNLIGLIFESISDTHVFRAFINWIFASLIAPASALASAVLYLQLRTANGEPPVGTGPATPGGQFAGDPGTFTPPPAPAAGTPPPPPPAPAAGTPPPPAPLAGTPAPDDEEFPVPQAPPAPSQPTPPAPPPVNLPGQGNQPPQIPGS